MLNLLNVLNNRVNRDKVVAIPPYKFIPPSLIFSWRFWVGSPLIEQVLGSPEDQKAGWEHCPRLGQGQVMWRTLRSKTDTAK